ncbi:MAG: extracellular solute-binding protein [Gaiellales bacterium]
MSHPNVSTLVRRSVGTLALVGAAVLIAAGCGSDADSKQSNSGSKQSADSTTKLVVYSGREQEIVEGMYKSFEKKSGIKLDVRYGDSAALTAQMLEEGKKSPADVFYAQDAGAIGAIEDMLAELPTALLEQVPSQFRDPDNRWTGVTGRARTLVYNTDELKEADLPDNVFGVLDPAWKGKVGVAPTNGSFIAFMSAMRLELGEDKALEFLEGLKANDAKTYEKNGPVVDAVAKGEVQVGLVNHYYLYERLADDSDLPIANHFFKPGDIGNLINTSAVGMLASSDKQDAAQELIDFLLTDGQTYIVEEAPEREYPLSTTTSIENSERYKELPALDKIGAPEFDLSQLGAELEKTVALITKSGLGS